MVINEQQQKVVKSSSKLVTILSIIAAVIFITILVIVKLANPEVKLATIIILCVVILLVCVAVIFIYNYLQKKKLRVSGETVEGKLPPPITPAQARELVSSLMRNPVYADFPCAYLNEKNELLGKGIKSNVYTAEVQGLYENSKYVIVMNKHYPNELHCILIDPSPAEINSAKRNCTLTPEEEPDVEEVIAESPLTGVRTVHRKIVKPGEHKEEKKEGVL